MKNKRDKNVNIVLTLLTIVFLTRSSPEDGLIIYFGKTKIVIVNDRYNKLVGAYLPAT